MAEFTKGCKCEIISSGYVNTLTMAGSHKIKLCTLHSSATAMFDLLKAIYRTKLYPERFTVKIEKILGEINE